MIRLLAVALLLLGTGCTRPVSDPDTAEEADAGMFPLTVRDDLDRTVTIARRPARIVSLGPAITETLFAVGAGPRLVAGTTTDNYPPEVQRLPKVGGFAPQTISVELILAQKPDLVLAGGRFQQSVVEAVARLGIPAVVIDPTSLGDVEDAMVLIGRLTGQQASANALVADFRRRREAVQLPSAAIKPSDRPRLLYVLWDEPLQTAGPATFVGQMIAEAGGQNIFADATQRYPSVSDESVLARNPEIILAPDHGGTKLQDRLLHRPGWERVAAIMRRRIVTVPEDLLHRPGPRIIEGLERLADLLRKED